VGGSSGDVQRNRLHDVAEVWDVHIRFEEK
jgi:hypothetical protein